MNTSSYFAADLARARVDDLLAEAAHRRLVRSFRVRRGPHRMSARAARFLARLAGRLDSSLARPAVVRSAGAPYQAS